MTVGQAITALDSAKYNNCPYRDKIRWLTQLDMLAVEFLWEFGLAPADFTGYDDETDQDTELLIGPPYDEIYLYFMESRIDYQLGEYSRFNNTNAMYEALWRRFTDHCIRNRMPKYKGAFR